MTGRALWRVCAFMRLLRDPLLTIAVVLAFTVFGAGLALMGVPA